MTKERESSMPSPTKPNNGLITDKTHHGFISNNEDRHLEMDYRENGDAVVTITEQLGSQTRIALDKIDLLSLCEWYIKTHHDFWTGEK